MKRREFIKLTGLVGTSLIGGVNIDEANPYNLWKPIPINRLEKTQTICALCKNHCVLNVYKRKELVISLEPDEKNVLCPKVLAYHNILYDRDRIKTPLLRSGKRGSFNFKTISYEKAIEILKEKINEGLYVDALAKGELEKYYLYHISNKINFVPDFRFKEVLGVDCVYFDIERSDLILNFGSDIILDNMFYTLAQHMGKYAKKIINFTPMIPNDSFLGSQWYPTKTEELGVIANKIINGLKGSLVDVKLQPVIDKIKNSKNICIVFSEGILESKAGINSLIQIINLAKAVNGINREGGIYFYKHQYGSRPFNLFREKINNYGVYNFDPFLIYILDDFRKALDSIPFIVYFGSEKTEIAKFADLIIPIPYFFERSDIYIRRTSQGFNLSLSPHAISGGVEAIDMRDRTSIELLFQKIFNYKAPYGIKDISQLVLTINSKLLEKDVFVNNLKLKVPLTQANPNSSEAASTINDKKLSLYLYNDSVISLKTRGSKWAEEMGHSNALLINPKTAAKYGLKHGQVAKISTHDHSIFVRVFFYEGIVEDVIALKRFKVKISGNIYLTGDKKLFPKDKEEKEIWWKNEDVELSKLFTGDEFRNIFVINQKSIDISKG